MAPNIPGVTFISPIPGVTHTFAKEGEKKVEETLIERLSNDPEAIAEFSRAELVEAQAELKTAGREQAEIAKDTEASAEDRKAALEAGREAKQRLDAVNEALAALEEEDAEISAEVDELAEAFEDEEPEEEEEAPEAETEEEPAEEAEVPEVEEAPEVVEEEPVAVAAAKPSIGALAKRAPKRPEPKKGLVASAGAPVAGDWKDGFHSPDEVGEAALKLWKSYGTQRVDAPPAIVASFGLEERGYKYELKTANSTEEHAQVIDALIKDYKRELEAGQSARNAIVASGGVCAPAQPVYDFFSISESAGMVQVPTVAAPRGALTYPVSSSYATIRANTNWSAAAGQEHSNADDVAGTAKNTFAVDCPDTTTCTVSAWPVILQFGNFAQRFYPEHVAHAMAESMTFHDHFVNEQHIADMEAAATAQNFGDPGGGSLLNVAQGVSFYAARYRDNFRMSPSATLELVVPAWVHDALAADLVARDSTQSFENAKGRVASLFGGFGLSVQFVQDWQSIGDNANGGYPDAADFLLYAPGTFVRLDGGSLDLGIVRDSTLNSTNDFQTFTETFEIICEVGHDAWALNDIAICPTGGTGNRAAITCVGFDS